MGSFSPNATAAACSRLYASNRAFDSAAAAVVAASAAVRRLEGDGAVLWFGVRLAAGEARTLAAIGCEAPQLETKRFDFFLIKKRFGFEMQRRRGKGWRLEFEMQGRRGKGWKMEAVRRGRYIRGTLSL
jgi:hypothetical protein